MGVPVRVVLYAESDRVASQAAGAAFARIAELDSRFSDYRADSELRRLSERSGEWTPVSEDLFAVLDLAVRLARATDGAFDPTVGPLTRLWRTSRQTLRLPRAGELDSARSRVGWQKISLDPGTRTVLLTVGNMRLDLGGVGKGYVLDQAMAVLERHGTGRALVEAGGDIVVGDAPPGRPGWEIAIPGASGEAAGQARALTHAAVSTSGDTEQFVMIGGVRHSHVVDPRTGLGVTNTVTATVIASDGATADAMATAVSVLGREAGTRLAVQTPGVVVVWQTEDQPD